MGTYSSHMDGANRELSNLRGLVWAIQNTNDGNRHGAINHACLTAEHLLKAIKAVEHGGETDLTGHNLTFFMRVVDDIFIPDEQQILVMKLDKLYTASRYDSDLDADDLDFEYLVEMLTTFLQYVEQVTHNHAGLAQE